MEVDGTLEAAYLLTSLNAERQLADRERRRLQDYFRVACTGHSGGDSLASLGRGVIFPLYARLALAYILHR